MLGDIKNDCDKFKDYENKKKEDEYNKGIASIINKLQELGDEMVKINDQEADLDIPITEYPLIEECKRQIKPFEELWAMVRDYNNKNNMWLNEALLKLNPEEVEKDHKTMLQTSNKLAITFLNNKIPKSEKIANDIKSELLKFRDNLPVIRSLCNPGLKTRHWDDIKKLIDMKDFKDNEKLSTLISLGISQYKDKLEDISETASKEYSNERTLQRMHDDWAPQEFTCKDWKNGSFILDGEAIEVIQ